MDAGHIAEYLNAIGEPDMAAEVVSMNNRLVAFANGMDREAFETMRQVAEQSLVQIDVLVGRLLKMREGVAEVADDLARGFVRCSHCGEQADTKHLDCVPVLRGLASGAVGT